jgi:hypothetical protein
MSVVVATPVTVIFEAVVEPNKALLAVIPFEFKENAPLVS